MAKRGKKYKQAAEKIDHTKLYPPREALKLAQETSYTSFDGTMEVHIRLGVDPRHPEQQVRDTVMLPHGTGKSVRVVVFAEGDAARAAQEAGADYIADDELIKQIEGGWMEFDQTVATPNMMGKVGRLGRVLGPRGLMPNPKAGTVVPEDDLGRVIDELKSGRVEFRADRTANLHVPIGRVSFDSEQLYENFASLIDAVRRTRPPSAKGAFFRTIVVTATMGPGVHVDPNTAISLVT